MEFFSHITRNRATRAKQSNESVIYDESIDDKYIHKVLKEDSRLPEKSKGLSSWQPKLELKIKIKKINKGRRKIT